MGGRQADLYGNAATKTISDRDVWQAALLMVRRYKEDGMLEASMRADQMLEMYPEVGASATLASTPDEAGC